jgi:serine/threonine protein kinase
MQVLYDYASTHSLPAVDNARVNSWTPLSSASLSQKPSAFGIIVPGNHKATSTLFDFLIAVIKSYKLKVKGSLVQLDSKFLIPYRPMQRTVHLALLGWINTRDGTTTPPPRIFIRENFGYLPNGAQSPVVDVDRINSFRVALKAKIAILRSLMKRDEPGRITLFSDVSNGATMFYNRIDLQLGKTGSEGAVFVGAFAPRKAIEKLSGQDLREFMASNDAVEIVAVKVYHAGLVSKECIIVNNLTDIRGVISYRDDFLVSIPLLSQIFVQELGTVDLLTFLKEQVSLNGKAYSEDQLFEEKMRIVRGLCLAVQELHRNQVIHRDLRAPNVVIMSNGSLKICDFGLSRKIVDTSDNQHKSVYKTKFDGQEIEYTGQPYEVIMQLKAKIAEKKHAAERARVRQVPLLPVGGLQFPKRPGAAAVATPVLEGPAPAEAACPIDFDNVLEYKLSGDIFMLGALIAWIVQGCQTGQEPFDNNKAIEEKMDPFLPLANIFPGSSLLFHLLSKMLSHEADKRPTIEEVLSHPFFQSWTDRKQILESLDAVLYNGGNPMENADFNKMKKILRPLENPNRSWWKSSLYAQLPQVVRDTFQVGFSPSMADGSNHPIPNVQLALRFCRNFVTHLKEKHDENLLQALMECAPSQRDERGVPVVSVFPSDFIICNESVVWLFLGVWDQHRNAAKIISTARSTELASHNAKMQQFTDDLTELNVFINKG